MNSNIYPLIDLLTQVVIDKCLLSLIQLKWIPLTRTQSHWSIFFCDGGGTAAFKAMTNFMLPAQFNR
jgi:hypothetical protein